MYLIDVSVRLLPLFPLPLVLFPGAPHALHIFEPRYRRMLADCLASDQRFGIIFNPQGTPERELARGHVGCVAEVDDTQTHPDGRSDIIVHGVERFALERFVASPAPYEVAEVSNYDDEPEAGATLEPLANRVRALFERVGRAARALADDTEPLPSLPEDPGALSFGIAAVIDLDAVGRQRLLASRSPSDRLRQLDALLAPAIPSLESRAVVHQRAKMNGHGPQPEA